MIKTEDNNVLTLYCQDKKIVTNGKVLRVELGFPYQIMSFRYVGENSKEYTHGEFYSVIDCSPYWYTNEIVVFVTDNVNPKTTDADYCKAFSFDDFLSDFEYDSKYLELMNKVDKLKEQLDTVKKALTEINSTKGLFRGGEIPKFLPTEDEQIGLIHYHPLEGVISKVECQTCGKELEVNSEFFSMAYPFCSLECWRNYTKYEGEVEE